MTFANITTGMVNKAIYAFGDVKKEGTYIGNIIRRTETINGNETTIKYSEIPQDNKSYNKKSTAELKIIRNIPPKDTVIEFTLDYNSGLMRDTLRYELTENDKKKLDYTNASVFEYSTKFGLALCQLKNEKNTFLPLIQKVLDRETNTDYKRYLQAIYDGVKLA